jgi:lipopolysaccharide export system protein LptA
VRFESSTGKASTDREATLQFDEGEGRAVGASYDPSTRELQLRSEVSLNWSGRGPKSRPMTMETSELLYQEDAAVIRLSPWSRLTRGTMRLEAGPAIVTLKDGVLDTVAAPNARGSDSLPTREIEYAADHLNMKFTAKGEVEKITGEGNAQLISKAATANTSVNTKRIDLEFQPGEDESSLRKALASGNTVLRSEPVVKPGSPTPDTRVLTSEVVELLMRPGGREVESIVTHAPGQIEFLPGHPGSRRRRRESTPVL